MREVEVMPEVDVPPGFIPEPVGLTSSLERAVVYTPQAGDVVVLEVDRPMTLEEADTLRHQAAAVFGPAIRVAVLDSGIRFVGVTREAEST